MTEHPEDISRRLHDALRRAVPADIYDVWLARLQVTGIEGETVLVEAPRELRAWIAERFTAVLSAAAAQTIGPHASVRIGTGAERQGGRHRQRAKSDDAPAPMPGVDDLNPKYTFDQFVIGDTNRFAHAAALAVAELPGQAYNPLFIYGPPGVGKTHLLHSIGNYVTAFGAGLTVRYATVETFTNDFIAALGSGSLDRFKGRYRRADLLLIDDVQFLASKAKTEEELFHTFNALYEVGSQLVLTSDRLPRDLEALADRLRERFESGLVTAIAAPDVDTRMTVLRKRVQHDGIDLPDEAVLRVLADRVSLNVRALEGALIRVVAFASLTGQPLTATLAATVVDDLYPPVAGVPTIPGRPSLEQIQELAAEAFDITRDELLSSSRTARLTWPRQVAMYLARAHTSASLPTIGASFGGRNHTTVLHACRRAEERLARDPEASAVVDRLHDRLRAPAGTESNRHD